ncbi:MAG: hypothetical protein ACRD0K_21965 [Egibacteraceae bacterium]
MSQGGRSWLVIVRRRLVQALCALLGATVVIWGLVPLAPGDPAERVLTARGAINPTPSEIEAVRRDLGLDRPLVVQYGEWVGRAVQGDLSTSNLSKAQRHLRDHRRHLPPRRGHLQARGPRLPPRQIPLRRSP